jgi:hypothetical protein
MKLIPTYANFGFTPNAFRDAREAKDINPAAILKSDDLRELHQEIRIELEFVRNRMKNYYNPKRIKGPSFKEGDMVYLATKNISTKRLSKKLNYKYIRPYRIIQKISENNYKLDLPPKVKLHLTFHVALLESAADIIQVKTGNKPEEIKGPEVYKAEEIRDIRQHEGRIEYLIK